MDKNKCVGCKGSLSKSQFMTCRDCKQKYDLQCANMTPKSFLKFDEDKKRKWKCPECLSKRPKQDNTNTPIRSESQALDAASYVETEELSSPGVSSASQSIDVELNSVLEDPSPGVSNVTLRQKSQPVTTIAADDVATNYITEEKFRYIWRNEMRQEFKSLIDASSKGLSDQLKTINQQCIGFQESVTFMSKQYDGLQKELKDLKKLFSNTTAELKSLRDENKVLREGLATCASRVKYLEEENSKQQQWVRLQNLEITGIPEHKDENTEDIVLNVSQHIGVNIQSTDIEFAHRIQPRRATSASRARPIIVRLKQRTVKDKIMAAARKHRNISARDIGLGVESQKIYINEHLTKDNKMLLTSCKQKAKELNYKYIWTKNCRVFVRKNETSPPVPINSSADIVKII